MKLKIDFNTTLLIISFSAILGSCTINYSMSGISIDYDKVKTISIQPFYSDISLGPANIGQTFTNTLTDYYQTNTNLSLIKQEGDLQIEGVVSGYRLQPVAPRSSGNNTSNDLAQLTRLTITVKVTFYNTSDDTYDFENRNFSFYSDFDNNQTLSAVEDQLIEEIFNQIVMDIFNASVANW